MRCVVLSAIFFSCTLLMSAPSFAAGSSEDIRQAQSALREQGYDPGPIDGVWGKKTANAVRSYQRATGLKETGEIDPPTAEKLGVAAFSPSPRSGRHVKGREFTMTYKELGWRKPETGVQVWERYESNDPSMITVVGRATGELIVPTKDFLYLLIKGERLEVNKDDCTVDKISIEPIDGGGGKFGPVKFTALDGRGFCQLGILGAVLPVGTIVDIEPTQWLGRDIPRSKVHITPNSLLFRPQ